MPWMVYFKFIFICFLFIFKSKKWFKIITYKALCIVTHPSNCLYKPPYFVIMRLFFEDARLLLCWNTFLMCNLHAGSKCRSHGHWTFSEENYLGLYLLFFTFWNNRISLNSPLLLIQDLLSISPSFTSYY